MTDLRAFIEARLTEDQERVERGQWMAQFLSQGGRKDPGSRGAYAKAIEREGGYSPARVLREVAAKRLILNTYLYQVDHPDTDVNGDPFTEVEKRIRERTARLLKETLEVLANVWSDHPDFQPEWSS